MNMNYTYLDFYISMNQKNSEKLTLIQKDNEWFAQKLSKVDLFVIGVENELRKRGVR